MSVSENHVETSNTFLSVFSKMKVPEEILNEYKNGIVKTIKITKEKASIYILIEFDVLKNEKYINTLQIFIVNNIPGIRSVKVDFTYKINIPFKELLNKIWKDVLLHVKSESIYSHQVLSLANYELDGRSLFITVMKNSAFILQKRGINKFLENLFQSKYNHEIFITFLDSTKELKQSEIVTVSFENHIENSSSNLNANPQLDNNNDNQNSKNPKQAQTPPPFSQNNSYSPAYQGKKRSSAIKIVNDLACEDYLDLSNPLPRDSEVYINGYAFEYEEREIKNEKLIVTFNVTDKKGSVSCKFFVKNSVYTDEFRDLLKKGKKDKNEKYVKVYGKAQYDDYAKEVNIMAEKIALGTPPPPRMDNAPKKRVELHLHTQMSDMDGINPIKDYVSICEKWGHTAIAITDHGNVQAFPDTMHSTRGSSVKPIYGVEAYLVDDLGAVVQHSKNQLLTDEFIVFDIETTGFQKETDYIIEIGAVKIKNGEIIDNFGELISCPIKLPEKIIEITKITDEMLVGKPEITEILPKFLEFCGKSVLVAHNASFDVGFISSKGKDLGLSITNSVIDTVELSRTLFPDLKNHKLNTIAQFLEISLENHHRAVDDATATAEILLKCFEILKEKNVENITDINMLATELIDKNKIRTTYHAIILVKNQIGMRNLYELISDAHINYFYRRPRIPKSEFLKLREGLIIGTACEAGEFYKAILDNKPEEYIRELADFYDFLEVQPIDNNEFLIRKEIVKSREDLIDINKKIINYGEMWGKPVVATGDVHFLNKEDEVYRKIIMSDKGFKDADNQAPLFYRTTEEMLEEFSYLSKEKAEEIVIDNTNLIADMIEEVLPIPDGTFPPHIEGSDEELRKITMEKAEEIYGSPLPKVVDDRLERELTSIIKNGFAVMYIIAQKLVWNSVENGYLVGSRGSVGSSFAATMAGITEVSPLTPHYVCPNCKYSDFDSEVVISFAGGSGCDMPDKECPSCGENLAKEGHDIPFETFLGFDGDKEPDIDLNFSGEYQSNAHAYTEELFGTGYVFKAGTISTIADKTAYGIVKNYVDEKEISMSKAEISRLKASCTGIKKSTGQHPGGLMVVPQGHSIYEFCPIQRPANDTKSHVTTTHFDYHSISGRLLKLDILGHDVPTIIRMLQDSTGTDPTKIDIGDKNIMSLFTTPKALGVLPEDINSKTGSLGLPEFGTPFVRQMLVDTQPASFGELVRISGLSHGTDVWFNNAQDLIKEGIATLKEVIPTRDDIMVYLIIKGVDKLKSFKIMENVRKGKGLVDEEVEIMKNAGVEDWYIESCRRIKYMFPKGHAVAYVMMTVRIGYYKIHFPYSFYSSFFYVKNEDFDYVAMCNGKDRAMEEAKRISAIGKEASTKEKSKLTVLELVIEMYSRGLSFLPIDLYLADNNKFLIIGEDGNIALDDGTLGLDFRENEITGKVKGLMPPLSSVDGLGTNAAIGIANARVDGKFTTIDNFRERTKVNKTVLSLLREVGILDGMPESDQISLFD